MEGKQEMLTQKQKKNNIIAAIISFFLPGFGQILLQDRLQTGLIFLAVWLISMVTLIGIPISFIAWIWAIVDAAMYDWENNDKL